jgi:hypothetical protein
MSTPAAPTPTRDWTTPAEWPAVRLAASAVASMPTPLLLAPLAIAVGVALLAWDYALLPPDPVNHVVYWIGLGLAFAGIAMLGTTGRPTTGRQLASLAVLGAVTWLPYFLRSPDRLVFVDELFHREVLGRILETGHASGLPVTLYPLPGTFPGLEDVAVATMGLTGLPMDAAIRVLTLLAHMTVPCLAYLAARGVRLGPRAAFLAALIYASNTSFFFFHSIFSYESLGIMLFLAVWALVALAWDRARPGWVVAAALPLLAGIAVTHHVSSYLLAASLLVGWLVTRARHEPGATVLRNLALLSLAFNAVWLLATLDRTWPYLWESLVARVGVIIATFTSSNVQPRVLFANADQPSLERLLAFSYPPLVLALSAVGVWAGWRHRGRRPLLVPLAILGPVAWVMTAPAVLTRSGELAYRAWPFLFLGVGIFGAIGLLSLVGRRRGAARAGAMVVVGVLLFGGISIGENQAGRFPTAPTTAGGGATNTPDVLAAAAWLRDVAGPGNVVATDAGTAVVFATEGRQRILPWAAWYPFLVGDPAKIERFVRDTGIEYLVLDRRITVLPPRYGSYFGAPPVPPALDPGAPIPASLPGALEDVPSLTRVYAGENIVIWQASSTAATR